MERVIRMVMMLIRVERVIKRHNLKVRLIRVEGVIKRHKLNVKLIRVEGVIKRNELKTKLDMGLIRVGRIVK